MANTTKFEDRDMVHVRHDRSVIGRLNQNQEIRPEGFFERHKIKLIAAGIMVTLGIAYLESVRRFDERMNNLRTKCNFMDCKPNDKGIFPSYTLDLCQCPPPEIAARMKFPVNTFDSLDHFNEGDYFKEADKVCNEGFDFISSDDTKEKVINFCKSIKDSLEAEENRKGYYQKFLEAIHLV